MNQLICRIVVCIAIFVMAWPQVGLGAQTTSPSTQPSPLPNGGKPFLADDIFTSFSQQAQLAQSGDVQVVEDATAPGGKVVRITLGQKPQHWWHAQVRWKSTLPVEKGRAVLVRALVRAPLGAPETGDGQFEIGIQKSSPPWNGFGNMQFTAKNQWKWIDLPLIADFSAPADGLQVIFNCGYQPQIIEIGAMSAYVFDAGIPVSALPAPVVTYEGREIDAAWRVAAAQRIEQHRKADLRVVVTDRTGNPVPNATVQVRMQKHAFFFGTCINGNLLRQDGDGDNYRRVVENLFNVVVHEGWMKWTDMVWQGGFSADARQLTLAQRQYRIDQINRMLSWTEARDIKTRGHTLVWPGWGTRWAFLPPYLKPMVDAGDKEGVRREIENRIRTAAGAFKGRVIEWDVVNESVRNTALQQFLGREEMVRWYKLAKQVDPQSKNVINDYMMLSGGAQQDRIDAFYDEVKFLLDKGAPIDAIGEQAHFGWELPGMERTWGILERFAAFGLPMRITEFDVSVTDEELQADYTRDFYTLMFSHPKIEQILMWGFWEGSHWMPAAAMFRKDWSPKPNYFAFHDLVFKQWWTNSDLVTDSQGQAQIRGFLGDYVVTVITPQSAGNQQLKLQREGTTVTIQLP
jgi:endo-1,4-beta-xylanase